MSTFDENGKNRLKNWLVGSGTEIYLVADFQEKKNPKKGKFLWENGHFSLRSAHSLDFGRIWKKIDFQYCS